MQVGKISGTVKKGFVGRVRQLVVLCNVNTTKYYFGGLVSGHFIKVVLMTGWIVCQCLSS